MHRNVSKIDFQILEMPDALPGLSNVPHPHRWMKPVKNMSNGLARCGEDDALQADLSVTESRDISAGHFFGFFQGEAKIVETSFIDTSLNVVNFATLSNAVHPTSSTEMIIFNCAVNEYPFQKALDYLDILTPRFSHSHPIGAISWISSHGA